MTQTLTLHPTFGAHGEDEVVVEHTNPACPFIAEGEPCDGDEAPHGDCRFCAGDKYNRADAVVRIVLSDTERLEGNYRGDRRPQTDGPKLTREERMAKVAGWLLSLGRKVEVMDITHENARAARDWLRVYDGDFSFLTDLKEKGRQLTDPQAKGVLNCWRADLLRPAPKATEAPAAMPEVAADVAAFIPGL